jgi:hypothetical protein
MKNWRKVSDTLIEWGLVLESKGKWGLALVIYRRLLATDMEHNHPPDWISADIQAASKNQEG